MKNNKTLLSIAALAGLMATSAVAQESAVIRTMDTASGDCLVETDGSISITEGTCASYINGIAPGSVEETVDTASAILPTGTRSLTHSTVLAPGD